MRSSDLPQVRSLELFESMSDSNFENLMQAAYLQTFPAQVDLISEGEPADFLYIVVEGCVELYAKANGRESTLAMVLPVGTFILAAVLKDAVYLMSARTSQRSRVLMIPSENIRQAFQNDEAFARSIVIELANCYRGVVKHHKDLKLRTAVERLANRLLRYHRDQGAKGTFAAALRQTHHCLAAGHDTGKPVAGVQHLETLRGSGRRCAYQTGRP